MLAFLIEKQKDRELIIHGNSVCLQMASKSPNISLAA